VLDFQPHKQKVDLSDDDILEMVLGTVVLELDVQAVLYSNLHFNAVVDLWHAP
jgi:hypothetical protein